MIYQNVLILNSRADFRAWLAENHEKERECYVACKRGRPIEENVLYYLDAVEEALCFGWIDSTTRNIDGVSMQRFSPRRKGSNWTELNKERCRRLERLGLMTEAGRAVMPDISAPFVIDKRIEAALKEARVWSKFKAFPPLYQRVRAYNIAFYEKRSPETYSRMLARLIVETRRKNMYSEWNDYGRLL